MGCFYCVSPTGVNYYEYRNRLHLNAVFSFRPQQGLTIMNDGACIFTKEELGVSVPNRG